MFSGSAQTLQEDQLISSLPAQHTPWAAQVQGFRQDPVLVMTEKFWEYEKQKLPQMSELLKLEGKKGRWLCFPSPSVSRESDSCAEPSAAQQTLQVEQ